MKFLKHKITMKSLRNLVFYQNIKIFISSGSSSKQALRRPLQIEWEEINEAKTLEGLEQLTGQSDPLNLVFSYFDSRFQEIQNQIRKSNRTRIQLRKNEKFKLKLLNKKVKGYKTNLTWKIFRISLTTSEINRIQFQCC